MRTSERGGAAVRLLVALAVLAAGYAGMAYFLGRHVPSNTSVAGVPIGGKTPADAEASLQRALAQRASAPIRLDTGSRTVDIDPSAAGLSLDLQATLDGLSGFSLHPAHVWNHLDGGQPEPLEISVDRDRLEAVLTETAKGVDRAAQEGAITFPSGRVRATPPVPGARLDVGRTAEAVTTAWPSTQPIAAAVEEVRPEVSAEEVARARAEFAEPAMAAPVKVLIDRTTVSMRPSAYAPALSMRPKDGRLEPVWDVDLLVAAVRRAAAASGVETKPRDATYRFVGGAPALVPARAGVTIDEKTVEPAFAAALASPARTARVGTVVVQPELTTQEARRIAPTEVISTFTTYFPDNPPRTNNIRIAARTLDGTFVPPGKQFSLNATLGQRTPQKGYAQAPVIINGRLVKDYGGGVSQVSTTLFNAAFFSGVRIEQYLPHSFYISRYPEGREATVSWPDVDQKWTNDLTAGILIRAYTSGNALTVTFYGKKVWDVDAVKSPRRNIVQPKKIVDDRASCVPQSPVPGFDVTVTRIFRKNGAEVRRSHFTTHYIPEDEVVCTATQRD